MADLEIKIKTQADNAAIKETNAELQKTTEIASKEKLAETLGFKEVSQDVAELNPKLAEQVEALKAQEAAVRKSAKEQAAANKSTKEATEDYSKLIPEVDKGAKSFKIFRAQGANVSQILGQLTRDFPAAGMALKAFMSPIGLVLSVGVAAFRVFKAHVDDVNRSLDDLSKFNAQPMSNIWTTQQTAIDDTIQKISAYKTALKHAGDSPDKVHDAFEQRRKEFDTEIEFAKKEIQAQGELEEQLIRTNAARSGTSGAAVESQLSAAREKTAQSIANLDVQKSSGNLKLLKEELQTRKDNAPALNAAVNAATGPATQADAALKDNQSTLDDARAKLDPNKGALILEKRAADEKLEKERAEYAGAIEYQKTVGGMLNPGALPFKLKQGQDVLAAEAEADAAAHKVNITRKLADDAEKAQQRLTDARNEAAKILEDATQGEIANKAKQAALERAIESQEALQKIEDKYVPRINQIQRKTGALKTEENQLEIHREQQPKPQSGKKFNLRRSGGGDFDPDRNAGPEITSAAQTISGKIGESSAAYLEGLKTIAANQERANAKLWHEIRNINTRAGASRAYM